MNRTYMARVARSNFLFVSVLATILSALPLLAVQPVWAAASQVPAPELLEVLLGVDSSAKGDKVEGTLSIHYSNVHVDSSRCDEPNIAVDLQVSLRAKRKNQSAWRSVGGVFRNTCYVDFAEQRTLVMGLIQSQLLPKLFSGFSSFAVREVDNLIQDEGGDGGDTTPFFMMTDFVLMVK